MNYKTAPGPGLLIGIPTLGRPVPLEWAMNFKAINPPINYNTNHLIIYGKPVAEARNEIAQQALALGCKYVFFLGDDVVPQSLNTLKQLIFRMEQDPELGVVGGVYCSKCEPSAPLVFVENGRGSYWDWKVGEYFGCTGLGMDCTLIRTEVFRELKSDWFKTVDQDEFADGTNQADQWTEDLYFCKRVLDETKYTIYCDGSLLCNHWDISANKVYNLPTNSLPMRRQVVEKTKRGLNVGCGYADLSDTYADTEIVRVDIDPACNPDYRCDISCLPFATAEFDLVHNSHVLEHFGRNEWQAVFKEWLRVLKPKGQLITIVPNLEWAVKAFKADGSLIDILNVFYGAQTTPYDRHYNGWWEDRIRAEFKQFPITIKSIEHSGYNMKVEAVKNGRKTTKRPAKSK